MKRLTYFSSTRSLLAAAALTTLIVGAHAETIGDTMRDTLRFSPQLQAARSATTASTEQAQQAKSAFGPFGSLDASLGLNRYQALPLVPEQTFAPRSAGVSMSLPLYTSGLLEARLSAAHSQAEAAHWQELQTQQSVLFDAANAYLGAARDTHVQELAVHQVQLLAAELDRARAELQQGLRTRTDTAQAEARLAAAQAHLRATQGDTQTALVRYASLVGRPVQGELALPTVTVPASLEPVLRTVLANNPGLQSVAAQVAGAAAAVDAARASDKASVSLGASWSRDRDSNPVLPSESSAAVMLKLTVPLFDSGLARAQVGQASALHSKAQAERDEMRNELQAQTQTAWEMLQSAQAQLSALDHQVQAATTALEGARAEYKAGTRTLLDVLNAEQELLDAQTNNLSAGYERVSAALRLDALQGQLHVD